MIKWDEHFFIPFVVGILSVGAGLYNFFGLGDPAWSSGFAAGTALAMIVASLSDGYQIYRTRRARRDQAR